MPREDYETMLATIDSSARDLSPFEQQFRARVNGELHWFQAVSVPELTSKGDVLWSGLAVDITTQKATESYLEQAKQRLELAQEVARIGYWEGNLATREVSWSALVYEIYGLKPELHQPSFELFNELVHPDDRQKVAASEDIARKTGKQDMTHRIIRPDGEMRWLHQLAYLHDEQVLLGTVYDITETKLLELREQSSIDPLTRLHNRRYFMDEGTKAIARALRTQQPLALLTMDLDNFKQVNDSYGHSMGDEVLKTLAHTAKSSFRGTDIVARIGGEEFVVLLDNTDQHAAGPVADKFRQRFGAIEHTAPDGSSFQVTVSIGIACLQVGREDLSELDTLMRQSDEALYQAKHNGRNRVELYVAS